MYAYCYASGLIEFGRKTPNGALPIAKGPANDVRDLISVMARHGYKTKVVNGRPTKVPGSDCLLVPGVPEAPDQLKAVDNLRAWCEWMRKSAPETVIVL